MKPRPALGGVLGGLAALLLACDAYADPAPTTVAPPPTNQPVSASSTPSPLAPTPAPPSPLASTPAAPPDPDTQSMTLAHDVTSRLTLNVMIDGQGPFEFLIDTGSNRTVISRELATTLNLSGGPPVIIQESTGADQAQTVVIPHLLIGNRMINGIVAPEVPAKDLGAEGMLGVDALRDLHIVMDFKAMQMSSSPSRAEPSDNNTVIVRGKNRFGELILVDAQVHGVPVYVVLDSGAALSVGNAALLRLLATPKARSDQQRQAEVIGVTGRKVVVDLEDIDSAHIGRLEIDNMLLGFGELPIFNRFGLSREPALLLGMDILSQCRRVSVDIRRREATFTLN